MVRAGYAHKAAPRIRRVRPGRRDDTGTDPLFHPGPVVFTPQQTYLAGTMRAFWTSLARYGRPLAPRAGVWQPFNAQGLSLSLVPPAPALESNFVSAHNCAFWAPLLLQEAGLPQGSAY